MNDEWSEMERVAGGGGLSARSGYFIRYKHKVHKVKVCRHQLCGTSEFLGQRDLDL